MAPLSARTSSLANSKISISRLISTAIIGGTVGTVCWTAAMDDTARASSAPDRGALLEPEFSASVGPSSDVVAQPAQAEPKACPEQMVLVEGEYCTDVRHDCIRWLDDETLPFARCAEYAPKARCVGERIHLRYCIDQDEYTPPGESLPMNWASFNIASQTCAKLGKRICTENEWNFACEGEEMRPYPYGWSREAKCNQDRDDLYENNPHRQILRDWREPSASRPECVSPFGVRNMVGNLDEPVLREGKAFIAPFRNALKGGWWMPARNRCRPATTAHDDYYKDIQVGVRCCAAAPQATTD